ncbi:MAG: universal stress protein [Schleiferiaceae bacterium]|jgi:nucleotide-binding universal stress UspA family protein|nr:universal stress protein [Schleiferiaceae bacterium]
MKKIAVLIDFTQTCYKSVEFAQKVYEKSGAEIVLLHVSDDPEKEEEIVEQVKSYANLLEENNTPYTTLIDYGKFFSTVEMAVAKSGADMVIVGTHGKSGLKQNLFGSNILKLVQLLRVSTLVVQDNSVYPENGFDRILFPVAPNLDFDLKTRKVSDLAKIYSSKICLYTLEDHMTGFSVEVQNNLKKTKAILDEEGLSYEQCMDESEEFSVGFARQTISFANKNDIPLISILSNLAKVNTYYGKVDKENILLNKHAIPVFCANDLE